MEPPKISDMNTGFRPLLFTRHSMRRTMAKASWMLRNNDITLAVPGRNICTSRITDVTDGTCGSVEDPVPNIQELWKFWNPFWIIAVFCRCLGSGTYRTIIRCVHIYIVCVYIHIYVCKYKTHIKNIHINLAGLRVLSLTLCSNALLGPNSSEPGTTPVIEQTAGTSRSCMIRSWSATVSCEDAGRSDSRLVQPSISKKNKCGCVWKWRQLPSGHSSCLGKWGKLIKHGD